MALLDLEAVVDDGDEEMNEEGRDELGEYSGYAILDAIERFPYDRADDFLDDGEDLEVESVRYSEIPSDPITEDITADEADAIASSIRSRHRVAGESDAGEGKGLVVYSISVKVSPNSCETMSHLTGV